jgi:sugar transferase EpsL
MTILKRVFDICVSAIALSLLAPVFIATAILVRVKLGSPILFRQIRPGLHGQPFKMMKFRTMTDERDNQGELLPDAQRLTAFGKFLRSSSLDELPELLNVLKGDMSLVGPRPLLMEYLPLYSAEQSRRHHAKPGITGWAQINGRNAISWEQKFALDVWYVDNQSVLLDIKILCLTVWKVFKREGISAAGEATMSKFTGSKE